jgi:hypothetical protein
MDFNQLLAKMRDLDQPITQSMPATEACGDAPMPMSMPPSVTSQPPPSHPSMSVNLNAQGMDNIESLMKLMTKVNPDMINQPSKMMPMPAMTAMPSLTPPGPSISAIGDLGNLDAGPLKMLPDLDIDKSHDEPDADNMSGPSDMDSDNMPGDNDLDKVRGDQDGDGDHDMDDHDMEKDDDKKNEYANEPDEQYKDIDYMVNKLAGGMNGPKGTYPKVAGGDNPMQRVEAVDLRTSIRNELRNRLAEVKSHQSATTMKHVKNPTAGEKKAAKDIKPGVAGYKDRRDMLKSAEADGRLKD